MCELFVYREEARRDEELSLEEQLRRKLTLTGYIFRSRKVKDEFPGTFFIIY